MSKTVPMPMTPAMFERFDDSSIRKVWNVMRGLCVSQLTDLAPIPYIDAANYFDLLNVFVEGSENVLDKTMNFLGRPRKFQYAAKLKDVVNFTTSDPTKIRQMIGVSESTMHAFRVEFDYVMEGNRGGVSKMYHFRAEEIRRFVARFELEKQVGVALDRIYPALDRSRRVLMITEVCCAERIFIRTRNGGPDDVHEWSYQGPVPIAFGASKLKLDKMGLVLSKKLVRKEKMAEVKYWLPPKIGHPPYCPVLRVVTKGKNYSMDRSITDSDEVTSTNSQSNVLMDIMRKTQPGRAKLLPVVEAAIAKHEGEQLRFSNNPNAYSPPTGNRKKAKNEPTEVAATKLPPTMDLTQSPRNMDILGFEAEGRAGSSGDNDQSRRQSDSIKGIFHRRDSSHRFSSISDSKRTDGSRRNDGIIRETKRVHFK